jgi:hypothetical protein
MSEARLMTKRCDLYIAGNCVWCYCHNVVDSVELCSVQEKVADYANTAFDKGFKRFNTIQKKSKMNFDVNIADKEVMQDHIDFQPTSMKNSVTFTKSIVHELEK